MRWMFVDPKNSNEIAEKKATLAKIDAWWQAFQNKAEQIDLLFSKKAEWDLPEWMFKHLQAIHPQLMWEYAPAIKSKGHRLVITPECSRYLRPLTKSILKRAPQIKGWEFYAYRLPENVASTIEATKARTGKDVSDYRVTIAAQAGNRIAINFFSPSIKKGDDQESLNGAFVAVETLLGEEWLDKWIGAITVQPMPKASVLGNLLGRSKSPTPNLLPLDRLYDTVKALISSIREQLPPNAHLNWVENASWTTWKLKPIEMPDYPEQSDLFVGRSANPNMWTSAHSSELFDSRRFSRSGETFCYLKLDGSKGLEEEGFADKAEIEDALDEILLHHKAGCTIGGGTGLRYSYIDLALVDFKVAVAAIRKVLQAGRVSKRSWIQFFDSDLCAEWIGIYPETPPPPMPSFED